MVFFGGVTAYSTHMNLLYWSWPSCSIGRLRVGIKGGSGSKGFGAFGFFFSTISFLNFDSRALMYSRRRLVFTSYRLLLGVRPPTNAFRMRIGSTSFIPISSSPVHVFATSSRHPHNMDQLT